MLGNIKQLELPLCCEEIDVKTRVKDTMRMHKPSIKHRIVSVWRCS